MTNHDPDRWLDSLAPGELDRAEEAETARTAQRVLHRLGRTESEPLVAPPRQGRSGPGRTWLLAVGIAAAVLGWMPAGRQDAGPAAPPAPARAAVAPPEAVEPGTVAPMDPVPPVRPVVRPGRPVAPAPLDAPAPDSTVAQASSLEFGAGLTRFDDTQVDRAGADAVLAHGSLRFLRDADHDPGVTRVVIRDLPLVIDPVGTEFLVGACQGGAAVMVQHGRVFLRLTNGEPLAEVREGESTLVLADPGAEGGLAIASITARGLDAVSAAAASHPGARTADVLAMVARLRLIGLGDAPVQQLLRTHP